MPLPLKMPLLHQTFSMNSTTTSTVKLTIVHCLILFVYWVFIFFSYLFENGWYRLFCYFVTVLFLCVDFMEHHYNYNSKWKILNFWNPAEIQKLEKWKDSLKLIIFIFPCYIIGLNKCKHRAIMTNIIAQTFIQKQSEVMFYLNYLTKFQRKL